MRPEKKAITQEIKRRLGDNTMFIVADHTGLSAGQLNELRSRLREENADLMVVKKSLFVRALGEDVSAALGEGLVGPMAIALGSGDGALLSRILVDFAKENEAPRVKAGFIYGSVVSAAQIGTIASLPAREVLMAQFIGGMCGPLTGFVSVLREMVRRFVSLLDQVARKQGEK